MPYRVVMVLPHDEGAEAVRREVFAEYGISAEAIFELSFRLDHDFSAQSAGFAQLADVEGEYTRAIVSDQILASVNGSLDNLLEARLHEHRIRDSIGPGWHRDAR